MEGIQRPLELILARNLLSSISTAAFLVDAEGQVIFFNEGAGSLLGRSFEETGRMQAQEWTAMFGPFDAAGEPIPFENITLTQALRGNKPAHEKLHIRSAAGAHHEIEASAFPIVGAEGFQGAIVIFWRVGGDNGNGEPSGAQG
jgi:PAS domain-containing protein